MLIDIFHDTVCPWCRIGKKYLFDALAQQEQEVHIRWHPFLLDNTVPADGYEFYSFMQNRKGIKAEEIQQMFDYTQRAGEAAGVKLDFEKIRLAVNTKLSHQLIALAPANVKNDVVEAIYKAYFEDGLNLGNIDVIVAIGTAYQMDASELKLQLNDSAVSDAVVAESIFARLNGINSVPLFVINNKVKLNGSHSVEVFLETLNRTALLDIPAKIW
ncbi:DsbA family oxidoreductase [Nostoc sp. 'Lobaria pulmonaria (5183) cyanobiont']|uniref:DsbA family oxidoreductase n=1 Tax=Nostoc sp. 'Lobaria pulmonaria (5183) cyanobiont' TaxID=1618022 RepID=UPI000CF32B8B|nr:DsbA family oxidoreductase [Nostoc sp. 'Lobaria pulmonaria (5183) cyanobiont']AVH70670.1 DSBA oxidoreductase/FrnE protein [Nostoc sp. 'Lobaria pulmonaria (5183) cyanobiont']